MAGSWIAGGQGFWGAVNFMAGLFNGVSECEFKG